MSCTSLLECTAVGSEGWPRLPLVERWTGSEWTVETPAVTTLEWSELDSVACSTATACMAVGYGDSPEVPLAEKWNGAEWTVVPISSPAEGELNSLSCTSASACTAVGGGDGELIAERWSGSSWTLESIAPPAGQEERALSSVSCGSATSCTAVGYDGATALVEHWNGTAWSQQTFPAPAAGEGPRLGSVSCVSATSCMAVGTKYSLPEFAPSGSNSALAAQWNGTTWEPLSVPIPAGLLPESESYLYGVSCTSATVCTATGRLRKVFEENAEKHVENVSLAEEWNGTNWSVAETPSPAGGVNESLLGVSCVAAAECLSVGEFGNTAEKSREALAEIDPTEAELTEIKQREKAVAERRLHEAEVAKKAAEEREAAARKAREEEEAAIRAQHEKEVASLKTTEEKAAAETRFDEEEAATKQAGEEREAAAQRAREEEEAAAKRSREAAFMGMDSVSPVATSAAVPPASPAQSSAKGRSAPSAKPLTEAQKLKACRRLAKRKHVACEARVRSSYSAKHGAHKK